MIYYSVLACILFHGCAWTQHLLIWACLDMGGITKYLYGLMISPDLCKKCTLEQNDKILFYERKSMIQEECVATLLLWIGT